MALVIDWGEPRKRTTAARRRTNFHLQAVRSGPIGSLVDRWTGEKRPLEMSPERDAIAALGRITRRLT